MLGWASQSVAYSASCASCWAALDLVYFCSLPAPGCGCMEAPARQGCAAAGIQLQGAHAIKQQRQQSDPNCTPSCHPLHPSLCQPLYMTVPEKTLLPSLLPPPILTLRPSSRISRASTAPSPQPLLSPTSTRRARPPHTELMPSSCMWQGSNIVTSLFAPACP